MSTRTHDERIMEAVLEAGRPSAITFIPEPEPEPLFCPIISVDDHLLEPPTLFEGRLPARFADQAPRLVTDDAGLEWWHFEATRIPNLMLNGASGREMSEWGMIGTRYDEMRRGVWDPAARLHDMDLTGVWASLCFPSTLVGFAGTRFSTMTDPDLGYACLQAYNDWMLEEWVGTNPERFVPCQLTWLADAELAAKEVRRNAARGVRAVSFSENPEGLGFPNIYTDFWDPFFAACEDTGTVVNLHVGSSGTTREPCTSSPMPVLFALFPESALEALMDWVFARHPSSLPEPPDRALRGGRLVGPDGDGALHPCAPPARQQRQRLARRRCRRRWSSSGATSTSRRSRIRPRSGSSTSSARTR